MSRSERLLSSPSLAVAARGQVQGLRGAGSGEKERGPAPRLVSPSARFSFPEGSGGHSGLRGAILAGALALPELSKRRTCAAWRDAQDRTPGEVWEDRPRASAGPRRFNRRRGGDVNDTFRSGAKANVPEPCQRGNAVARQSQKRGRPPVVPKPDCSPLASFSIISSDIALETADLRGESPAACRAFPWWAEPDIAQTTVSGRTIGHRLEAPPGDYARARAAQARAVTTNGAGGKTSRQRSRNAV